MTADKEDALMKKSKAVAATAMLFCAAANLTACVYGPPPDVDAVEETVEETVEESDEASETSDSSDNEG